MSHPEQSPMGCGTEQRWLAERRDSDQTKEHFRASGAVPVLMHAGDVLFHNILLVYGSPYNLFNKLRRVV